MYIHYILHIYTIPGIPAKGYRRAAGGQNRRENTKENFAEMTKVIFFILGE